jgi:citrate synthase
MVVPEEGGAHLYECYSGSLWPGLKGEGHGGALGQEMAHISLC